MKTLLCGCSDEQPCVEHGVRDALEGWCFDCEMPVTKGCVEGEHAYQLAVTPEEYEAMAKGVAK